ncbi:MAG: hypothetical protein P9M15_03390, partial [Candidatus Electryoneaceae bacterium]|nr:hypothetical protein [Candidatus Electryoneaceae bacterium]
SVADTISCLITNITAVKHGGMTAVIFALSDRLEGGNPEVCMSKCDGKPADEPDICLHAMPST